MYVKRFRIPRAVVLPGLVVPVVFRAPEDLEGDYACWEDGAIHLSTEVRAIRHLRYLLYHELHHAVVDALHSLLLTGLGCVPRPRSEGGP